MRRAQLPPGLRLPAGKHFGEDTWFAWRCKRGGARSTFGAEAIVRHAVFGRGGRGYIAERARCRYFPVLVQLIPELRAAFLYRRWFLSPTSARFDLALTAIVLAATGRARPTTLPGVMPYLRHLARRAAAEPPRQWPRVAAIEFLAYAVAAGALLTGSARAGRPVL